MQNKLTRRKFLQTTTTAAAGIALVACTPAAAPASVGAPAAEGGATGAADAVEQVLRMRVPNPFTNVWPNRAGGEDRLAMYSAYAPPYWLTPDGGTKPGFALSHEISEDGLTWTLNIDPEAVFSNGNPITAKAVKRCWEWGLLTENAVSWGGSYLLLKPVKGAPAVWEGEGAVTDVEGLVIVDDHTLQIEFDTLPYGWEGALSQHYLGVYDVEAAEADRDAFLTDPITSGPYTVSLDPDTGVAVLDRNPNWWREAPSLDRIEHVVLNDEEAAFIAFDNGEFDMLRAWLGSAGPATERWPDLKHLIEPGTGMWYFGFYNDKEPLDDIWVRRALLHAIDRHTALEAIAPAAFTVVDQIVGEGFPCKNDELAIAYDLELAREELAKSRYGSGENVPPIKAYYYAGRPVFGDVLAYFQDVWRRELGIEVEVQEWQGDYPDDIHIGRLSYGPPIPDESYYLSSWGRLDGNLNASMATATEETDALLREADSLPLSAQEERCALYQQAEEILIDEARLIPLVSTTQWWIIQPWVQWDEARFMWPYALGWEDFRIEAH